MNGRVTDPRSSSALREHELLARLGLGPGASNDEVEAAHDEILDFLGRAPGSLRGWARVQVTDVDEAYARLNGAPPSASYAEPVAPPPAPVAATPAPLTRGGIDDDFDGFFDEADEPSGPVVISRRERRAAKAQVVRAQAARPRAQASTALVVQRGTLKTIGAVGVAMALVAAIVLGVYGFGTGGVPGINGTPAPAASGGLDMAQVSDLMQKITANPKDTVSLMSLATLYYGVGDYTTAQTWLQKLLDVDPKNVTALLALGAAHFNTGDDSAAEITWRQVLAIDPKNVEAHYDLGFMYFSQNPPNVDKVREEWGQVVALAPDSDIAQTIKTHLAQLGGSPLPSGAAPSGAPGGSPAAASPAPGSSAAPASSPAASPAAS
jgi:Tfp pilus assembly protein PilF